MKKKKSIAILGAGIMGSSTALYLARRGHSVKLYDACCHPLMAASRWNEGKIHLGFIYSADPSLRTAKEVLPGGLFFNPLVEELIGHSPESATTEGNDLYLCHRDSVVSADDQWAYMKNIAELVRQNSAARRYLVDVSDCRVQKLTPGELAGITESPDIVAGFSVPERSVNTNWVADRFVEALSAEHRIEQHMNTRVKAVSRHDRSGRWLVNTESRDDGPYDYIINALWDGRMAIDVTAGLEPEGSWSNRYRLSLFVRTREPVDAPSAIIATGPFGDIKNYDRREFYLSWYPAGLLAESLEVAPTAPPVLSSIEKDDLSASIVESLASFFPGVAKIRKSIERCDLRGGWVFAAGKGKLSDPQSTLHRRSDFGIRRSGSYISVDTGKYSTAPWLARKLAALID